MYNYLLLQLYGFFKMKTVSFYFFILGLTLSTNSWDMQELTETEVVKIVVIGGGMSGLAAAYELSQHNMTPVMYEARDHLGGRTHTHYFDKEKSIFFEEGGTFIDSNHKKTIDIAQKLGVDLQKNGFGTPKTSFMDGKDPVKPETLINNLKQLEESLLQVTSKLDSSSEEILYSPLEFSGLNDFSQKFLRIYYESETGSIFEKAPAISAYWLYKDITGYRELIDIKNNIDISKKNIDEEAYHHTVQGGMSHFVKKFTEALELSKVPIHLNHILTGIKKSGKNYVLTFESGEDVKEIFAEYVIMTLPFSTLRHVHIHHSVDLPQLTKEAIETLPYGTNGKIGIPLNLSTKKCLQNQMLYYIDLTENIMGWPGEETLTLYVSAKKGEELEGESVQPILNNIEEKVKSEFPCVKSFDSKKWVFKNWFKDPFAQGSYSTVNSTSKPDIYKESTIHKGMRAFAEPFDNNHFIFAGEHTRTHYGYIESAIQSGIEASSIILKDLAKLKAVFTGEIPL